MWENVLDIFNQSPLPYTATFQQHFMKSVMSLAFGMSKAVQTEISTSTFMSKMFVLDLNQVLTYKQMCTL